MLVPGLVRGMPLSPLVSPCRLLVCTLLASRRYASPHEETYSPSVFGSGCRPQVCFWSSCGAGIERLELLPECVGPGWVVNHHQRSKCAGAVCRLAGVPVAACHHTQPRADLSNVRPFRWGVGGLSLSARTTATAGNSVRNIATSLPCSPSPPLQPYHSFTSVSLRSTCRPGSDASTSASSSSYCAPHPSPDHDDRPS